MYIIVYVYFLFILSHEQKLKNMDNFICKSNASRRLGSLMIRLMANIFLDDARETT